MHDDGKWLVELVKAALAERERPNAEKRVHARLLLDAAAKQRRIEVESVGHSVESGDHVVDGVTHGLEVLEVLVLELAPTVRPGLRSLADQTVRATTSVALNLAEGAGRRTTHISWWKYGIYSSIGCSRI